MVTPLDVDRTDQWQAAGAALAAAVTLDTVVGVILRMVAPAVGACVAWVALSNGEAEAASLRVVRMVGAATVAETLCAGAAHPLADAARTGEPVLLRTLLDAQWRYPDAARAYRHEGDSFVALPLTVGGMSFGALGLAFSTPDTFDRFGCQPLLAFTAAACALALDRVRLSEAIRSAARATTGGGTTARRRRAFLRDILGTVTSGRLRLCLDQDDLPDPLTEGTYLEQMLSAGGLGRLRTAVLQAALRGGISTERAMDLVIAAGEAGMNAIVHAGGGTASVFTDPARRLVQVWIRDHGRGIGDADLPRATLEQGFTTAGSLGYGFPMMIQTVDYVSLLTGPAGTVIVLEQGLTEAPLPAAYPPFLRK
jgi:anti-sigma regulatory factor (Ser/Thr protein kinase)